MVVKGAGNLVKEIVVVPETHWDREWYLPFQEYRARLVALVDGLIELLQSDPDFKNFTLDGQTVVLEDYLEVRPGKRGDLESLIAEGRISVGPWYVLPDEFLVSAESLVRNIQLGHVIAQEFGRVMRAGYVPDPFGHVAQLPQILAGFGINSCLFARGFGNEFEELGLGMEFLWRAPGNAASILGVHLVEGYGSVANLPTSKDADGRYAAALARMERVVEKLSKHATTDVILLNNGSDHLFPQPELPEIVRQWNEEHEDAVMVNADFEEYVRRVIEGHPKLKGFSGELRGARYRPILSGVLSTRMWIKQANHECQMTLEKYAEPACAVAWLVCPRYEYPVDYLWLAWKWLLKNHPHDSICGCSIDEVHEEMRARFAWARGIAGEAFKDAVLAILPQMTRKAGAGDDFLELAAFNPHPWPVTSPVTFEVYVDQAEERCPIEFVLKDPAGRVVPLQDARRVPKPRYHSVATPGCYEFSFVAEDLPPTGVRRYYLYPYESSGSAEPRVRLSFPEGERGPVRLENEELVVEVAADGSVSLTHKQTGARFEGLCELVDEGDWGDEYDFSWPKDPNAQRTIRSSLDAKGTRLAPRLVGPTCCSVVASFLLPLPEGLEADRSGRSSRPVDCAVEVEVRLAAGADGVDVTIHLDNRAKDHRLRVAFPTNLVASTVRADGHFMVVERPLALPDDANWSQPAQPTNHQGNFVDVTGERFGLSVLNRGLPEYEARVDEDGRVTLLVTLLRCVGWLSRGDLTSRPGNAGPDLATPGAQCLGKHEFHVSLRPHAPEEAEADLHRAALEFAAPPLVVVPGSLRSRMRARDKVFFSGVAAFTAPPAPCSDTLPEEFSFLEVEGRDLVLTAVKRADDGTGLIVRVVNYSDQNATGVLKFAFRPATVVFVDFCEEVSEVTASLAANFEVVDRMVNLALAPRVIATLKVLFPV
ncbi:MAG: alpha-mannosidase [Promethearchaeota archaeon]